MSHTTGHPHCQLQEADSLLQRGQDPQENMEVAELVIHPDSGPSYEAEDPAGDYLDMLESHPLPLSMETLKAVRDELESRELLDEDLRACFELALEEFPQEPSCVRRSAQMVIESASTELTFLSGTGKCKITISDCGPCYEVEEPTARVYLARLHSRPPELSIQTLQGVRDALEKWGLLDTELGACVKLALAEFHREPPCVQDNARLVIRHKSKELVFVSGRGECEISVCKGRREPGYEVREPTAEVYRERLRSRPQRLRVEVLAGIQNRLESWGVMTKELRCCFALALEKFPQEPVCVRDNPGMCLVWDNTGLQLISKDGDCEVSVTCRDRKPSYKVTVKSWATYRERLSLSAEPLSKERLEGVCSEAKQLAGTPEKVKEALNVAVRDFFTEPACLQENARLVIECDRGELVFVSGKGENKVDVCFIDGKISYSVRSTKWVSFSKGFRKLLCKLLEAIPKLLPQFIIHLLPLLITI